MTDGPTVVFVNTEQPREWLDKNGKMRRAKRSYYEVGVHLPDRNEVVVFPVPISPDATAAIAAIMEALA